MTQQHQYDCRHKDTLLDRHCKAHHAALQYKHVIFVCKEKVTRDGGAEFSDVANVTLANVANVANVPGYVLTYYRDSPHHSRIGKVPDQKHGQTRMVVTVVTSKLQRRT